MASSLNIKALHQQVSNTTLHISSVPRLLRHTLPPTPAMSPPLVQWSGRRPTGTSHALDLPLQPHAQTQPFPVFLQRLALRGSGQ